MNKCLGCGNTLSTNPLDSGYTPNLNNPYCERCFRLMHYGEEKKVANKKSKDILKKINNLGLFTLFVTDFLSLNTCLILEYKKIKAPKILVINKCDLIPPNLKYQHLKENIQKSFNLKEDIFFISAKKGYNLSLIEDIINKEKQVIIAGETSSGKSTLINNLIGSKLTTSKYQNTTLDFIKLNYLDNIIYDSPGLIIRNNFANITSIVVKTCQLKKDYVLKIGDVLIKGDGYITCYLQANILVKSSKKNDLLVYSYTLKNEDIELNGGFIYVKGEVKVQSNMELKIRKSFIGK